jgi:hypothetical protein
MSWEDLSHEIGLTFGALILLSIRVGAIAYNGFTKVVDRVLGREQHPAQEDGSDSPSAMVIAC